MHVLGMNLSSNPQIIIICGCTLRLSCNGGITQHSDIVLRNILIKDGKIAAIVDWESVGWYPEYWEYTQWAASNYMSSQIWHDLRDVVLDPYPDKLRVDEYLSTVFTHL